MNFDEYFDMCRMGIILYGLYPSAEVDKSLLSIKPCLQWKTHISHIKTLEPGREISYGGTYVTTKETRVATVPVGYADGYPRCLSNKGKVIVNGKFAPIIGRVCMDQFMIDVSGIEAELEDKVTLVGTDGGLTLPWKRFQRQHIHSIMNCLAALQEECRAHITAAASLYLQQIICTGNKNGII